MKLTFNFVCHEEKESTLSFGKEFSRHVCMLQFVKDQSALGNCKDRSNIQTSLITADQIFSTSICPMNEWNDFLRDLNLSCCAPALIMCTNKQCLQVKISMWNVT